MSSHLAAEKVEIAELVSRYLAALDQKQFERAAMSALFTSDARVVRPNGNVMLGPQAIGEGHARSLSRFRATQHLVSGFIVEPAEGEGEARFRTNLVAVHLWADGHGDPDVAPNDNQFVAGGVLSGRAARGPDGWKLAELSNLPTWRRGTGMQQMLETK
jgi:ketosteroid isomerase-like protein